MTNYFLSAEPCSVGTFVTLFVKYYVHQIDTCTVFSLMQLPLGIYLSNILMVSRLLTSLKKHINTFYCPDTKSIFGIHDPVGLRYIFQLRVSLGPLRGHKWRHNFVDTPSEMFLCNQGIEDTINFLFSCPLYAIQRVTLKLSVVNILY